LLLRPIQSSEMRMTSIVKHRSIFVALALLSFGGMGCGSSLNRTWETNRNQEQMVGIMCENTTSDSCYIFTGYAADVDSAGVVTIIDEDHNMIRFVNMSCVIAPSDQIGDDACIRDVMPDLD
jgi:hypothetical protein